ncbi:MAG: hypothetical protein QNJ44_01630 [Rhodobacter sp.]|nr:hypothetical protein [Rhodobacter sp.]
MINSPHFSNYLLAIGTLVAALFVAVQAWYARTTFVQSSETRFLEKKLEICFENFDAAAQLDTALRSSVPAMMDQEIWPPRVEIADAEQLDRIQRDVVPKIDYLEAGLTKASVLGPLDKFRGYLAQRVRGLSKGLLDLTPNDLGEGNATTAAVLAALSEFLGAQYQVFTGCRLLAEGKA